MNWIILATLAPLMFVIYQALAKLLPQGISVFLVNAYASIIGALTMLIIHLFIHTPKTIYLSSKQILLAIGIGLFISFGNFFIIKAYSLGAPQSTFSAIMYPLLIVYAFIFGILIWHEKMNTNQILGSVLVVIGIIMILGFKR